MSYSDTLLGIACLLQIILTGYALRLNHVFGTARIGWPLFGAFAILAVLHVVQALGLDGPGRHLPVNLSLIYMFITILLLIGLAHIEVMMRARLRVELEERRLRSDLENVVEMKTAKLTQANQALQEEVRRHTDTEARLAGANEQLQNALLNVKRLRGLLPICCRCKRIRNDKGYWQQVECYVSEHSEARFSHGICPECARKYRQEME